MDALRARSALGPFMPILAGSESNAATTAKPRAEIRETSSRLSEVADADDQGVGGLIGAQDAADALDQLRDAIADARMAELPE